VGCRLHAGGNPICAVEMPGALPSGIPDNDTPPCFSASPSRLMELSWFQYCGPVHSGGGRDGDAANYFRQCTASEMDMFCRDRFRLELTKTSLTLYVNGFRYLQDAGWKAPYLLPDSMVNGGQVYTYFADWQNRPDKPSYRFHWGRLAVNPHDTSGMILPPSAAPSFCLGQPGNTCPMDMGTPTPQPTATNTPNATATKTSTPTSTPVPAATVRLGTQSVNPAQDSNQAGQAEAFQYTAASSGPVNQLGVYLDSNNAAGQVVLGLYTNTDANNPGTLLAKGTASGEREAWVTATIPAVTLTEGQQYWLAALAPTGQGTVNFRDVGTGSASQTSSETSLTTLPATWSPGTNWATARISGYAAQRP
jgi:hypothetical protein